jgi:phospholipid-binding lipoprotein MlaA
VQRLFRPFVLLSALGLILVLSACGGPRPMDYDPLEPFNRGVHEFNRDLDRAAVRPVATGYDYAVPDEFEFGISDFARNADTPRIIVNQLLQFRIMDAGASTLRFTVNSTLGLLGFFDAASTFGIPDRDTDFGQTLHRWGVGEIAYVELPLAGPSTLRDGAGAVVDLFLNPLSYVLPVPERYIATVAGAGSFLSDRARFRDTVDSVLYESADSYQQARLAYLQKRRFELGLTESTAYENPMEDPYFDPYSAMEGTDADPLSDPYFDPYAASGSGAGDPLSDPYFDPYAQ